MNMQTPGAVHDDAPSLLVREEHDGALLLVIDTNQIDDRNADQLRAELEEAMASQNAPKVVVSLERVNYLSSAALGVFIAFRQGVARQQGQLRLCGLQHNIAQVFRLTKLNLAFQIHDDSAGALTSF